MKNSCGSLFAMLVSMSLLAGFVTPESSSATEATSTSQAPTSDTKDSKSAEPEKATPTSQAPASDTKDSKGAEPECD